MWWSSGGKADSGLLLEALQLIQLGQPEETEGKVGWVHGRHDSLAGFGDLALREPPTEICLLLARTRTLEDATCALGPCP